MSNQSQQPVNHEGLYQNDHLSTGQLETDGKIVSVEQIEQIAAAYAAELKAKRSAKIKDLEGR